jgi:hypothetical protein
MYATGQMLEVSAGAFRGRLGYSHASYEAGVYRIFGRPAIKQFEAHARKCQKSKLRTLFDLEQIQSFPRD